MKKDRSVPASSRLFLVFAAFAASLALAGVLLHSAHLPHSRPGISLEQQLEQQLEQWARQEGLTLSKQQQVLLQLQQLLLQQQHQAHGGENISSDGHAAPEDSEDCMKTAFGGGLNEPGTLLVARAGSACSPGNTTMPEEMRLPETAKMVAPVVIVAHDRNQYLAKTLFTVLRYWEQDPGLAERFPLFVSVDGNDTTTLHVAASWQLLGVRVIQHQQDPACNNQTIQTSRGYCHVALHYRMLLQLFFVCLRAPRLIFLEEDMLISPDFFSFFQATAPLLEADPSIWCISAWNDHGQGGRASNSTALYRTDVFPGLGWMLTAEVGRELLGAWPATTWDSYLRRNQSLRRGRQCVFPEVPRTHNIGLHGGVSGKQFFREHIQMMLLNKATVDWAAMDLSYLRQDNYRRTMASWLAAAVPLNLTGHELEAFCRVGQPNHADGRDLLLQYQDLEAFKTTADLQLNPMVPDVQDGAPRCSYHGVAVVRCRGRRLFLAPPVALESVASSP